MLKPRIVEINKYPDFVPFEQNDDGRNTSVVIVEGRSTSEVYEETGKRNVEVLLPLFPDRKSDIKEGVVALTGLKEMISKKGPFIGYAFAQGYMPKYEWPKDEDIAEWIATAAEKNSQYARATIHWFETTNNGRLVCVLTDIGCSYLTSDIEKNIPCRELDRENGENRAADACYTFFGGQRVSVKWANAEDFIESVAFEGNKMPKFEEMAFEIRYEGLGQCVRSYKFYNALVSDAEEIGFIKQYEFCGVRYFRMTDSRKAKFLLICYFDDDDIRELAKFVSDTNRNATESFKKLVKKGRLRIKRDMWDEKIVLLNDIEHEAPLVISTI